MPVSQAKRDRLAKAGKAFGRGKSFPVGSKNDWENAAQSLGRTDPANRAKVKARLRSSASKYGINKAAHPAIFGKGASKK